MAETLTITDNRTGKQYELPITDGTIRANDLKKIKVDDEDGGLATYDPAFMNTAACRSRITYIDGDKGILLYRGYPIEQLAEHSTYLETAYLILFGELPTPPQLEQWTHQITMHTMVHENIKKFMEGFQYDAHPMGVFISTVGALSTFYTDGKQIFDERSRKRQIHRLIAKVPTIAAYAYRHSIGRPYVYPDNDLSFTGNFLNMLFKMTEVKYKPNPALERALDVLFILHADHEQNCSTSAMRNIGSSQVDPYSALAGAAAALYGPLHGGANEAVLRMLKEIGSTSNIPAFIKKVKAGEGRLMGFGHRVYKSYDPRAKIIKQTAYEVFEVTGKNPLLDIALELEKIALEDEYFISRKLYPNVDFYSGLIYQAMGFDVEMFPVLFAIARTVGWVAQWEEMLLDPDQKIARPKQIYTGAQTRDYIPMSQRRLRQAQVARAGARAHSEPARCARDCCCQCGCGDLSRLASRAQSGRRRGFDSARAWEHLRAQVAIGPRVAGHAEQREDARSTSSPRWLAGHQGERAAVRGADPDRPGQDGERHRDASRDSGRSASSWPATSTPSCSRSSASSAPATARRAPPRCSNSAGSLKDRPRPFTIELLFLDGEEAVVEWSATDSTYGSRHYVQNARRPGTLAGIKAIILLDMIGDSDLNIRREQNSTRWLTDIIWRTARRLGHERQFLLRHHAHRGRPSAVPRRGRSCRRHHRSRLRRLAHRRRHARERRARRACRSSGMSCWRRFRRSNSGC